MYVFCRDVLKLTKTRERDMEEDGSGLSVVGLFTGLWSVFLAHGDSVKQFRSYIEAQRGTTLL